MEGAVISPVIQKIAENFISNPNAEFLSRLLFTIPALSFAISAFFIGYIIDKLGRKPVLIVSLVLYIIFGSSGFYLNNIYAILCSRALLGISAAGVTNTVLTLIGDYYTGKKRNRVVGFQAAFTSFGGVTYLLLGGALGGIQWNYPFLIYLIPVLFLPLALVFLPEPSKDTSEILTIENEKIRIEEETEENAGVQGKTTISIIIMCYIFIFFTMIALYHVVAQFSFYVPTKIPTISSFLII
jgi:MFS family permease